MARAIALEVGPARQKLIGVSAMRHEGACIVAVGIEFGAGRVSRRRLLGFIVFEMDAGPVARAEPG